MKVLLFGLSASGKSFVGNLLSEHYHYYFWDADQDLSQEMRESIETKQVFTQAMRDRFTQNIIDKMKVIEKEQQDILLAQAFYKESNRLQLKQAFPDLELIHVQSEPGKILSRLNARQSGIDLQYAHEIGREFENPLHQHHVLLNNTDEKSLIEQWEELLRVLK